MSARNSLPSCTLCHSPMHRIDECPKLTGTEPALDAFIQVAEKQGLDLHQAREVLVYRWHRLVAHG